MKIYNRSSVPASVYDIVARQVWVRGLDYEGRKPRSYDTYEIFVGDAQVGEMQRPYTMESRWELWAIGEWGFFPKRDGTFTTDHIVTKTHASVEEAVGELIEAWWKAMSGGTKNG